MLVVGLQAVEHEHVGPVIPRAAREPPVGTEVAVGPLTAQHGFDPDLALGNHLGIVKKIGELDVAAEPIRDFLPAEVALSDRAQPGVVLLLQPGADFAQVARQAVPLPLKTHPQPALRPDGADRQGHQRAGGQWRAIAEIKSVCVRGGKHWQGAGSWEPGVYRLPAPSSLLPALRRRVFRQTHVDPLPAYGLMAMHGNHDVGAGPHFLSGFAGNLQGRVPNGEPAFLRGQDAVDVDFDVLVVVGDKHQARMFAFRNGYRAAKPDVVGCPASMPQEARRVRAEAGPAFFPTRVFKVGLLPVFARLVGRVAPLLLQRHEHPKDRRLRQRRQSWRVSACRARPTSSRPRRR